MCYVHRSHTLKVMFRDLQDPDSGLTGITVNSPEELGTILDSVRDRQPFCCEMVGQNDLKLTLGIGPNVGFVQYSADNGDPPYFVALAPHTPATSKVVEFLAGDTATPIDPRFCLSFEAVKQIASDFLRTGQRSRAFLWEEI